jgi:hypothetical protein
MTSRRGLRHVHSVPRANITRTTVVGVGLVAVLLFFVVAVVLRYPAVEQNVQPVATTAPTGDRRTRPDFLYGRITAVDGATYEGRLRWGRDQEAFWGDYFYGVKKDNPWAVHVPGERRTNEHTSIEIFGLKIGGGDRQSNLTRPFMARFGDIARIEARFRDVQVTLKSGTVFELDRFAAGDIDDGVRVWDRTKGITDIDARRIRTVEFLPNAPPFAAASRLHGTVRTAEGDFTGFIQWDRQDCVGDDELEGRTADGARISLRYETIRSIARRAGDSALVTLRDGREMVLSGTRDIGSGNRGIYVDDGRYGRVLVSWAAFERVEFSPGGSGPGYDQFPPGRPLAGEAAAGWCTTSTRAKRPRRSTLPRAAWTT